MNKIPLFPASISLITAIACEKYNKDGIPRDSFSYKRKWPGTNIAGDGSVSLPGLKLFLKMRGLLSAGCLKEAESWPLALTLLINYSY